MPVLVGELSGSPSTMRPSVDTECGIPVAAPATGGERDGLMRSSRLPSGGGGGGGGGKSV